MGVIKIGHYSKSNPWSRISKRGFFKLICPYQIKDKVGVDDLDLIAWYKNLTAKDEKKLHRDLSEYRICGEWFDINALKVVHMFVDCDDTHLDCSKDDAVKSYRRL